MRYTARSTTVKMIRLRSSGTLPMLEKADRADMDCLRLSATDQHDFAAGLSDLLRRGPRERVRGDGQWLGQLPVAEHLHVIEAALHDSACDHCRRVHLGARGELREIADIDLGDDRGKWVTEAALGQAAL